MPEERFHSKDMLSQHYISQRESSKEEKQKRADAEREENKDDPNIECVVARRAPLWVLPHRPAPDAPEVARRFWGGWRSHQRMPRLHATAGAAACADVTPPPFPDAPRRRRLLDGPDDEMTQMRICLEELARERERDAAARQDEVERRRA